MDSRASVKEREKEYKTANGTQKGCERAFFLNYLQDFLLSDPTPNVEKKYRICWTKTLTVY